MTDQDQKQGIENTDNEREFALQRVYIKDLSYETPNSPQIFNEEWAPESTLNLNSEITPLGNDNYEVVLSVTVTTRVDKKVAFLVEAQQAGIFTVKNFPNEDKSHMLGSYCPNILFPYVREVVSDLVAKGTFPQLLLTPVNFDALYAKHQAEQVAKDKADTPATTH
ncbi:Protein-export protein SecB (maintains pre-export unfolded state) [hydrothermal vent metagenome]|uniref:Protein-export protein SecB (Maintains pre-export unfolded state) n=1 Tax=hydrothermal vent metagenome TaxID=652676 RepID=A0A3B1B130_9ZZZZ